jgi:hypothetical protein
MLTSTGSPPHNISNSHGGIRQNTTAFAESALFEPQESKTCGNKKDTRHNSLHCSNSATPEKPNPAANKLRRGLKT